MIEYINKLQEVRMESLQKYWWAYCFIGIVVLAAIIFKVKRDGWR